MHKKSKKRSLNTNSIQSLAIEILNKNNPMTIKEITEKILQKRKLKGKTPYNSVNTVLQRSTFIKKVGRGLFTTNV